MEQFVNIVNPINNKNIFGCLFWSRSSGRDLLLLLSFYISFFSLLLFEVRSSLLYLASPRLSLYISFFSLLNLEVRPTLLYLVLHSFFCRRHLLVGMVLEMEVPFVE